jgi:DNA polymerase (family X)
VAAKTEEDIYKALGLPFIEPEVQEGRGEIAPAERGKLPKLVADADIRGILHAHTDRSDGGDTREVMAEATRVRGFSYFGVADHSQSAHYAGGLSLEDIAEQHAEADRLSKRPIFCLTARLSIRTILAAFDFVVAACIAASNWIARSRLNASLGR